MGSGVSITVDRAALEPLIKQIGGQLLVEFEARNAIMGDKLCYGKDEASRLLGLKRHQLRDARLQGKISYSRIVGGRIRYLRDDLLKYLADNRCD